MVIKIFNSLARKEEELILQEPNHLKMYVCGPTVYDRPHIGNARSAVVYDMFFRLFKKLFNDVTYVRNITDVDDKINYAAKERSITISELTKEITRLYHQDMDALNVLRPTIEPRATEHINEMIFLIENLIKKNHAYISDNHVLFDVNSYDDYGILSRRSLDEMIAGSRIEIASYKRNPLDFVLWKPSDKDDDPSSVFISPWGPGRPGWHIECSAMSFKYLGKNFDIHGGGADLQFPHHENEIAQSCCAHENSTYAKYWIHNGFLTVNKEKMSKSLKNFITVNDLLEKNISGIVIRYLLLATHYRKPLDYSDASLDNAQKSINKFYSIFDENDLLEFKMQKNKDHNKYIDQVVNFLCQDLNTSMSFAYIHSLAKELQGEVNVNDKYSFIALLEFFGLIDENYFINNSINSNIDENFIIQQIELRNKAKKEKNWQLADKIRSDLYSHKIVLEDVTKDKTIWKVIK